MHQVEKNHLLGIAFDDSVVRPAIHWAHEMARHRIGETNYAPCLHISGDRGSGRSTLYRILANELGLCPESEADPNGNLMVLPSNATEAELLTDRCPEYVVYLYNVEDRPFTDATREAVRKLLG